MFLLASLAPVDIEGTCCVLVLGGVLAETLSFLAELLLYLTDRKKSFSKGDGNGREEGRKLLGITLPIAFTTYVRSGLLTLEHILIPEGLRNSGSTHSAALRAYGTIQSMALPIILYPAALISSFAGLLVPEMAESSVQNGEKRISYMVCRVWSLSLLFSIGVAGILICFSGEIGQALYPNTQTAYYIRWLAPLIPIMYVDTATDAMLKGLGQQVYSMKINITDALISVILVWLLIPRYGILGYVLTIYFSETFNTVFSINRLLSLCEPPVHLLKWVYKPLLCIVGATCGGRVLLLASRIVIPNPALSIVFHCLVVLILYLLLLLLTQSLDREDLQWIKTLFCKERSSTTRDAAHLQE
ncbi:MAG: polysaccharide biosynthesis C-terminal domain-containing protein [Clostridia bacterium]|nr:polysaccharide biosynthesis C-terminal domain-containing protein [Clostridia bacterium]